MRGRRAADVPSDAHSLVPSARTPDARAQQLHREKRVLLTREEELAIERLVRALAEQLGTVVTLSHVLRALILMILESRVPLLQQAAHVPRLVRPANSDAPAREAFERRLAVLLLAGLSNNDSIS